MSTAERPDDEPPEIDLSYDPKRLGKRIAGASSTTTTIYEALVAAGDQGRTVDELVDQLAELIGTMEYRKYERYLKNEQARSKARAASGGAGATTGSDESSPIRSPHVTDSDDNFTGEFMRRGRQWAIKRNLKNMVARDIVRREGKGKDACFFTGARPPNVALNWEVRPKEERTIVAPHDPARTEAHNNLYAAVRGAQERAGLALAAGRIAKKDASISELLAVIRELMALLRM